MKRLFAIVVLAALAIAGSGVRAQTPGGAPDKSVAETAKALKATKSNKPAKKAKKATKAPKKTKKAASTTK